MVHERFICPVGQGGFSIEMIDGFVVVYDCGSVSSPNAVEQSIDKLWQDADHVDVLFISHFDKDHVNSIRYLLSHIKVLKAVTSFIPSVLRTAYGVYTDGAYTAITQLLKDNGVDTEEIGDGEVNKRPYYFRNIWEWIAKSMMTHADFSADNTHGSVDYKQYQAEISIMLDSVDTTLLSGRYEEEIYCHVLIY